MGALFLTPDELAELTAYKRHGKQIEALRAMGIPCTVNAAGRPIVARAVFEQRPSENNAPKAGHWFQLTAARRRLESHFK